MVSSAKVTNTDKAQAAKAAKAKSAATKPSAKKSDDIQIFPTSNNSMSGLADAYSSRTWDLFSSTIDLGNKIDQMAKYLATQPAGDNTNNPLSQFGYSNDGKNTYNKDGIKPQFASEINAAARKYHYDPAYLMSLINHYSEKYNVDPNFVCAIIKAESSFNPVANSSAGAKGLMQLMSGTAKDLGVDRTTMEGNVHGGVKYLAQLMKKFKGSFEKVVGSYNAGPGNADKWDQIAETRDYVQKVGNFYFNA